MARFLSITLTSRGVSCRARLLEEAAPRTCALVWDALPVAGQAYHGKYARNEVYTLLPPLGTPGRENTTVTPIPGDVCFFSFDAGDIGNPAYGYDEGGQGNSPLGATDLAIFYGRNNLLLNGDVGWVPGNVFATIEEGLTEMAAACNDLWMAGAVGEQLAFARA